MHSAVARWAVARWAVARWALAAALGLGLALRLWGLDFGLPHTETRPDESLLVHRALAIAGGDLNPHFFNYPSLHLYLLAAVSGLSYATGWLLGGVGGPQDFLRQFMLDPSGVYLAGRTLTALMGTATIALVYHTGRGLGGPVAGVCGAILLAGAFLHVRDSHFLTVDVPATFWAMAAFAAAARHLRTGGQSSLLAAAVLAGLAASTKYNAALFLPALIVAAVCSPSPTSAGRRVLLVGVAWLAALVVGSPFILLDLPSFWRDFSFEWHHFGRGHGLELGSGWWRHLAFSLRHGLGWPMLLAALVGLIWLVRRRRPLDLVLVIGVVAYYAVAGSGGSLFVRYVVPLVPLLCVAAGAVLCQAASGRLHFALPAALLIAAPSIASSVAHDRLLQRTDTREQARQWIEQHVPTGSVVALTGSSYGHPQLRPTKRWLAERLADVNRTGAAGRRLRLQLDMAGGGPEYEIVTLSAANPQRLATVWEPIGVDSLARLGVDWLVVQSHPLSYAAVPGVIDRDLPDIEPTVEFDPFQKRPEAAVYDPIDAYYMPLAGHAAVDRPGPRLRIYALPDALEGRR